MKKILIAFILAIFVYTNVYANSIYDELNLSEKRRFNKYIREYLINFTGLNKKDLEVFSDNFYKDYFENDVIVFALAVINNETAIMKKMLVKNKNLINAKNSDGSSMLLLAIVSNAKESIKFLVNNGVNVNELCDEIYTPLTIAVGINDIHLCKFFVSNGANVNYKNGNNDTALDIAVTNYGDNSEIAKYLKKVGAKRGKDL